MVRRLWLAKGVVVGGLLDGRAALGFGARLDSQRWSESKSHKQLDHWWWAGKGTHSGGNTLLGGLIGIYSASTWMLGITEA